MLTINLFKTKEGLGHVPQHKPNPSWCQDVPANLQFKNQADLDTYLETAPPVGAFLKYTTNRTNFDLYCFYVVLEVENNFEKLLKNSRSFPLTHKIINLNNHGAPVSRWDSVYDMEVVSQEIFEQHLKPHHDHIQARLKAYTA